MTLWSWKNTEPKLEGFTSRTVGVVRVLGCNAEHSFNTFFKKKKQQNMDCIANILTNVFQNQDLALQNKESVLT